ncbi:Transcription factor [Cordyceps fumosorosea ARSEF 2679]|uniref:Transcription factor n=1 Tax=Cordyceps fumosorosea (strain ARSEF 2679) TaxID=1081104 RepID=A0A162MGF4_CORFA|nr:Transcription factor [Cordyceps fumosorosea ARSEF 2679]OAA55750.1 Transcription factor [Cordyceps fumosorosea ARSEF 2679]
MANRTGACQRCHYRKVRCDRTRPSCGVCARVSAECEYAPREHQIQLRRHDVERLEQRLRQLQQENDSLNARLDSVQKTHAELRPDELASSPAQPSSARGRPPTSTASIVNFGLHQSQPDPETTTGHHEVANQVIHLSLSAGGARNFVGSTSGLFLANLLQPQGQPSTSLPQSGHASNVVSAQRGQMTITSALPPKSLATQILSAYCNQNRMQYPFLDPTTLWRAFENVYSSEEEQNGNTCRPRDAFIVNMTLAIGTSQVSKLNWSGMWDAESSYNRAAVNLGEVLSPGGIPALQALLLVCQYRMGTPSHDNTASVWHLVGVAARMCFELGLHKASTYVVSTDAAPATDPEEEARIKESDIKRRCFWSVVAMDRTASLVLGRPMAIQLDDVDAELPQVEASSPQSAPSVVISDHQLTTSIFVHIVRYRLICGKILNALHRTTTTIRAPAQDYEATRDELATELLEWHRGTSMIPLGHMGTESPSPSEGSSFRCQEWYDLLYHNGMLMLFRPSPCLCDTSRNSAALQHVHDSSQTALLLYADLHRTGRINYSWVTLHSVFIAGLSYIYALRNHLQHSQNRQQNDNAPRANLSANPTIGQVVNTTRACSKVLVAVSERWAVARNCSEVFDKLSDAVVADVVESQMANATSTQQLSFTRTRSHGEPPSAFSQPGTAEHVSEESTMTGLFNMSVDSTLRDCFGDLQNICYDQYHSDAIVQLSQDWLVDLANAPGQEF